MKLRYTRRATEDVRAIRAYIARDNPSAADRVLERIGSVVEHLPQHPCLGRTGRVAGTREFVVPTTPHIVAYRIGPNNIDVIAVIHAARKWPNRF